ncbi:MAG: hypothetical protein JNM96_08970 [Bacteroidia bacterium]|nr:hypothetical protein [Bacteroidia bacterium]
MHYANPFKGKPESSFDFFAYTYCSPYFHQDFKLFAPVPHKNMDILVSYEINKQQQRSFPLHEVLYGKLWPDKKEIYLLSLTNSGNYIIAGEAVSENGLLRMQKNKDYDIFKRVIVNYLFNKHKSKPENVKLILVLSNLKDNSKNIYIDF